MQASTSAELANSWVVLLLCGAICVVSTGFVIGQFAAIRSVNKQFLALTPDGVVEHESERYVRDFAASFGQLANTRMEAYGTRSGDVSLVLVLTFANGAKLRWQVDRRFGPSAAIAQRIIAAYSLYSHEPGPAANVLPTTYNKLVCDRIPEIIRRNGDECETDLLAEEDYRAALRKKLIEEAREASSASGDDLIPELADLHEVLDALLRAYGISDETVQTTQMRRREERGGFDERVRLLSVEQKPERQF
jgi:predicted house-cleaning noncanonical NTP pyrophosphatase (MazG superfamily)